MEEKSGKRITIPHSLLEQDALHQYDNTGQRYQNPLHKMGTSTQASIHHHRLLPRNETHLQGNMYVSFKTSFIEEFKSAHKVA